jgi:hypothetical protein
MIVAPTKTVVTVGVRDLIIVDTKDALLVADLRRSQDIGKAVQELEKRGIELINNVLTDQAIEVYKAFAASGALVYNGRSGN